MRKTIPVRLSVVLFGSVLALAMAVVAVYQVYPRRVYAAETQPTTQPYEEDPGDVNIKIEATPNNTLALNNVFKEQAGIVGVLATWSLKYTGSAVDTDPANVFTWWWRKHNTAHPDGAYTLLGTGAIYLQDNIAMGDYDIELEVTNPNALYPSYDDREVQAASLVFTKFDIVASGNYIRAPFDQFYPQPDARNPLIVKFQLDWAPAVVATGTSPATAASPTPSNIYQGIIQGCLPNDNVVWAGTPIPASYIMAGPPPRPAIQYPGTASINLPNTTSIANDAHLGTYLYGGAGSVKQPIGPDNGGKPRSITDLPHVHPIINIPSQNPAGDKVMVQYLVSIYVRNDEFSDWLVVEVDNKDADHPQFVPLKLRKWKVAMDTSAAPQPNDHWNAVPDGDAVAPTQPTDGSTTSTYSFEVPKPGLMKTFP